MNRLVIARHGNTFETGETPRRVGARTDMPLTAKGQEQARAIGEYLKDNGLLPTAAFSSHLKRTYETANMALIAAGCPLYVQRESIFDEIDYGPDENRTEEEVIARIGKGALQAWEERGDVPPGWLANPAEITASWLAFGQRVLDAYPSCTVLVVTSNGIARFAPHLTGNFEGFRRQHDIKLATGALGILEYREGSWTVKDWNVRPGR